MRGGVIEFGPDALPVGRAKIASTYRAFGGALDFDAALWRHGPRFIRPLTDQHGRD